MAKADKSVGACESCGKQVPISTHHLIPRWLDGDDGITMEVCGECHHRFDTYFDRFVKWGDFQRHKWTNGEKKDKNRVQYNKKYIRTKSLFNMTLEPHIRYLGSCRVNLNTESMNFCFAKHVDKQKAG